MHWVCRFGFFLSVCLLLVSSSSLLLGQGKVYLVLGSDTAIWDGMNVDRFNDTYSDALFTDPTNNAYKVMAASFRAPLVDSYGQTIKFTWWMMGGNIFRYATNRNIPLPNTMTLYLMRKYHGNAIETFGDEITMHYHTFVWTDYDKDGIFWWNQAHTFNESRDDLDVTLAEYLLEENTFPVSFRSGWHAMDNDWQHYLDALLPFCMHDDWPAIRSDTVEPIDNVYDWSKSSKEWVPFHPSWDNYQLTGNLRSWNLRSTHIGGVNSSVMDTMFAKAGRGADQVACLWGHLPETDFLDNMVKIDRLAHASAVKYPSVKFHYCTAVEAMQRWRGTTDVTPPIITITEQRSGDKVTFDITTNEAIFQSQPFVAAKDLYERYYRLATRQTGTNKWSTTDATTVATLAKIGVAVTDTSGNLQTGFINYLPDDIYVDNLENGYAEVAGTWTSVSNHAWGTDSRVATLGQSDSAKVHWKPNVIKPGWYNIFVQMPAISNAASKLLFRVINNGQIVQTVSSDKTLTSGDWVYLTTSRLDAAGLPTIEMVANSEGQVGTVVCADALKLSALIRDRQLVINNSRIDFGDVSEADTARVSLPISNRGTSDLLITSVSSSARSTFVLTALPLTIGPMQSASLPLGFSSSTRGHVYDSLLIISNDPLEGMLRVPVSANVINYFTTVDNEDSVRYREYGTWFFSNAEAYGNSSRYAWSGAGTGTYARFSTMLKREGTYDIQMIVPKTVNASTNAKYVLSVANVRVDSTVIDQNVNSGAWVAVLTTSLSQSKPIDVTVSDVTSPPVSGLVLRSDALRFMFREEATVVQQTAATGVPESYLLLQNHPNPFNPSTRITFAVPNAGNVILRVYDLLGRQLAVLHDGVLAPGWYTAKFDASHCSSGVYLYRLEGEGIVLTKKMMVLK